MSSVYPRDTACHFAVLWKTYTATERLLVSYGANKAEGAQYSKKQGSWLGGSEVNS